MIRARAAANNPAPFRLLYSVASPESVYFRQELNSFEQSSDNVEVTYIYTRSAPDGQPVGRLDARTLEAKVIGREADPSIYICGATGFVETVSRWLVDFGYSSDRIKTERYGGVGGAS
jgi:ferredoxin-NADP reductase